MAQNVSIFVATALALALSLKRSWTTELPKSTSLKKRRLKARSCIASSISTCPTPSQAGSRLRPWLTSIHLSKEFYVKVWQFWEAEKTFTKEVESGPEEVEDCQKVARWLCSLKIEDWEKVWNFVWLLTHWDLSVSAGFAWRRPSAPLSQTAVRDLLNMWNCENFECETKMYLVILSHDRGVEELLTDPGGQVKLFCNQARQGRESLARGRKHNCLQSLLHTWKVATLEFPPVKQHFVDGNLLLLSQWKSCRISCQTTSHFLKNSIVFVSSMPMIFLGLCPKLWVL